MLKNLFIIFLMMLYLYTLSFNIFLPAFLKIPAPLILGLPLIFLFKENISSFLYGWQILTLTLANFFYYSIGLSDVKTSIVNLIIIVACALYFNYFVGFNRGRFTLSLILFFSLLFFSNIIMLLDHVNPSRIDVWRGKLAAEIISQSPSGIAATQFTFGYQLAALASFLFIYIFTFNKPLLIKIIVLLICIISIYLGMQRSVLVTFICSSLVFLLFYYNYKSILIIGISVFIGMMFYTYFIKENLDNYDNIFAKNERKTEEHRSGLFTENLKIYADYPYGLIFYGKNWGQVIYRNKVFSAGITSHNAYMMFFTYLGPFLGLGLLLSIYYKIGKIFIRVLQNIKIPENSLLICLCFSFLAISINSFFHNAWLINANGPTVFLFFSVLHLDKLQTEEFLSTETKLPSKNTFRGSKGAF